MYLCEMILTKHCGNHFMICKSNHYVIHLELIQHGMSIIPSSINLEEKGIYGLGLY